MIDFQLDAGYTEGETLDELTDAGLRFIERLKSNAVLQRMAQPHLYRPAGRLPKGGYQDVIELGEYQAESWLHAQRVVLVVKASRRLMLQVARVVVPVGERLHRAISRWRLPPRFASPSGSHRRIWRPPPRHAFAQEVRRL